MSTASLTVHLQGGLGNQMFQYAAGRALSQRSRVPLYLDTWSGFARDRVYKRRYELGALPIMGRQASAPRAAPFLLHAAMRKVGAAPSTPVSRHVYGELICETEQTFMPLVAAHRLTKPAWMHGYWQNESYFRDIGANIARELTPPPPRESNFLALGERMSATASVAVGVRLFEEVPGATKEGVGGLTPMSFFSDAARLLAESVPSPVFYVFCTTESAELAGLDLPGQVKLVTHDNGYRGSVERLWLLSQCRHHILSNSSFYWWGAWLREALHPNTRVIASQLFANRDTVPRRWTTLNGR